MSIHGPPADGDALAILRARSMAHGHGLFLGGGTRGAVFGRPEVACLVCGPPREGKTSCFVVTNILSAVGPVVATSTKRDVLDITAAARSRAGRCWLFDPSGTVPCPSGVEVLRWSPIAQARRWDDAAGAAKAMAGASAIRNSHGHDDHWATQGLLLLGPLLHAAALAGGSMRAVREAVAAQDVAEPLAVLERHGARIALSDLVGELKKAGPEVSGIFSSAADILEAYRFDAALERSERVNFDPRTFVRSGDTVYICAPAQHQAALAPIIVAFVDAICHATYARAAEEAQAQVLAAAETQAPGRLRRLPPVALVLDELANIAPLPDLNSIVSQGGSQGISLLACLQDLSQARALWPTWAEGFPTLFGTSVLLRGIKDRWTLELYSALAGERDVRVRSVTSAKWRWWYHFLGMRAAPPSVTISLRRQRRLPPDVLFRGRPGMAVLFDGPDPPAWMRLTYWKDDPLFGAVGTDIEGDGGGEGGGGGGAVGTGVAPP